MDATTDVMFFCHDCRYLRFQGAERVPVCITAGTPQPVERVAYKAMKYHCIGGKTLADGVVYVPDGLEWVCHHWVPTWLEAEAEAKPTARPADRPRMTQAEMLADFKKIKKEK